MPVPFLLSNKSTYAIIWIAFQTPITVAVVSIVEVHYFTICGAADTPTLRCFCKHHSSYVRM